MKRMKRSLLLTLCLVLSTSALCLAAPVDKKISDLPTKTSPAAGDYVPLIDSEVTNNKSRKVTVQTLANAILSIDVNIDGFAGVTDFASTVSAAGNGNTTWILMNNQALSGASYSLPASLMPISGASLYRSGGVAQVYFNAPVYDPGLVEWISVSSVSAYFTANSYVRPDWWKQNTTPGTTDMSDAIMAAIRTGKHVVFSGTTYAYRGGVIRQSTNGQYIYGNGSTLQKLSGATGWEIGVYTETQMWDLRFYNPVGGAFPDLYSGAHRSQIGRLIFEGAVSSTGYPLRISGSNLCEYGPFDLYGDRHYGGILIDNSFGVGYGLYYSTIKGVHTTAVTEYALKVTGGSAGLDLTRTYIEDPVYIQGTHEDIHFYNLNAELSGTPTMILDGRGGLIQNVTVNGGKSLNASVNSGASPFFEVRSARNFHVSEHYMYDSASGTSKPYVTFDSVTDSSLRKLELRNGTANAHLFLSCPSGYTRSDNVVVDQVGAYAGTFYNSLKLGDFNISNVFSDMEWQFISGSQRGAMSNIFGNINTNNVLYGMTLTHCRDVTDTYSYATQIGLDGVKSRHYTIPSPAGGALTVATETGDQYTGNVYTISGNNNITSFTSASRLAGRTFTLIFTGTLNVSDEGVSGIDLEGANTGFSAVPGSSLDFACNGTTCYEKGRKAN
ncbi:MAG: hypothetical protein C4576_23320 [Desulfobacteraceae bacterium]|nr:MAG: hypothetical protein C4576_23320 [Desulfobacteraceae bacterium]